MSSAWPVRPLSELCTIRGGGTPSKAVATFWEGSVPWISPKDMKSAVVSDSLDHVSELAIKESATSLIPAGAVLIVVRSGILARTIPIAVTAVDLTINQDLKALYPHDNLDVRFLYHFLAAQSPHLLELVTRGATVHRLTTDSIRGLSVPVPPLPEQRRIVAILDEAFAGIAAAKEAVEQSIANAAEVFSESLARTMSGGSDEAPLIALGDLCQIARGGSPRPIKEFITDDTSGVNWIKISDATASGKYIYTTKQKIIAAGVSRSRLVNDGDFLLSNSMSFGRPYIMRTTGCIHDGWLVLSDYGSRLDQDYLYLALGSRAVYRQFDEFAAGSTVRNLNIELASKAMIPVPSLESQRSIAASMSRLSSDTTRLTSGYEAKLAALDELKQSLLHHAFTGQL